MEPNEAHELQEEHEQAAKNPSLRPVSFTMSVLAVLVAISTVLGHRTHTEAVLAQAKASDQWNEYQAKKIRSNETQLTSDLLSVLATNDDAARKLMDSYKAHAAKWNTDLAEEQEKAQDYEAEVRKAERKANRFDLGEALLEIGLVVTSITLLTRLRTYWYLGMGFGLAGFAVCATVLLLHT
jgi:NAD dependent epimerase/dehydratase family enzyme